MPFSSKQIELKLSLDLLFGKSGLSLFQNKPTEPLEETDAASEQKSLTDCLFRDRRLKKTKGIIKALITHSSRAGGIICFALVLMSNKLFPQSLSTGTLECYHTIKVPCSLAWGISRKSEN